MTKPSCEKLEKKDEDKKLIKNWRPISLVKLIQNYFESAN